MTTNSYSVSIINYPPLKDCLVTSSCFCWDCQLLSTIPENTVLVGLVLNLVMSSGPLKGTSDELGK